MPRNLLQDMIRAKYPSTGGIPERRATPSGEADSNSYEREAGLPGLGEHRSRYALWLVAAISVIFFIFSISYLFSKATIAVDPKMKDINLNEDLSASLGAGGEALSFELIVISGEENKMVQAVLEKDISEKAQGAVLIYNAFSSKTQRLDIDTRLEGSNGKIYKTKKQIIVPGMKGGAPGSVEVGIYAAEAGSEYNSGPLDFTIFGFRGTPKYSKFYARSKGEIAGGFKGKAPVISDTQKQDVINDLKTALRIKLFKKATDQIPNGFVLFKDAIFLDIDEDSGDKIDLASSKDSMLPINIKGTLYGFLFNEEKLTKKIAKNNINEEEDDGSVYMPNIQDLVFSLSDKDDTSLGNVKNINFNLSGAAKIVWKLDEKKLKEDLLGKPKKNFNQILLQYPNIDSAESTLRPFWKMSFPDKAKNIKVIVNYP